eukprot:4791170-Pyramimonas_sp.AAC.1
MAVRADGFWGASKRPRQPSQRPCVCTRSDVSTAVSGDIDSEMEASSMIQDPQSRKDHCKHPRGILHCSEKEFSLFAVPSFLNKKKTPPTPNEWLQEGRPIRWEWG